MWEEGQLAGWIEIIEFLGGFNGFSWDSYIWWIKLPMKLPWGNNNPYTIYDLGYFLSMRVLTHSHMSSSFCWVDFSWDSSFSIFLVDLPIKDGDFPQFFVCFIYFYWENPLFLWPFSSSQTVNVYQMVPPFLETPIAVRWKAESIVDLSTSPALGHWSRSTFQIFQDEDKKTDGIEEKRWSMKNLENGKVV